MVQPENDKFSKIPEDYKRYENELRTCNKIEKHKNKDGWENIVKFLGSGKCKEHNGQHPIIYYEKCHYTLEQVVGKKFKFDEKTLISIIYQLNNGICFLHNIGISHEDIKMGNVMIKLKEYKQLEDLTIEDVKKADLKIIDFDLTSDYTEKELKGIITEKTENEDMYQVGLIGISLLHGEMINQKKVKKIKKEFELSKNCIRLIQLMLQENPMLRIRERDSLQLMKELYFDGQKPERDNTNQFIFKGKSEKFDFSRIRQCYKSKDDDDLLIPVDRTTDFEKFQMKTLTMSFYDSKAKYYSNENDKMIEQNQLDNITFEHIII